MRKIFLTFLMLIAASFVFTSCDTPAGNNAANNAANKPANNANTATAPAADKTAAEADLKKLINGAAESLAKNDADAMDKIYGDDYMLVTQDGVVQSKAERIAAMKSGDVKFSSFAYNDINVRFNPEVTGAVVIAKATFKATQKGKAIDGDYRVTQVWGKDKSGAWKQHSGQATKIEAGAAPAKADDKKADEKKADNKAPANK